MEPGGARHSLDRLDPASLALEAEDETRENRPAVDENRARPALAELAAVLRAHEREVLAQDLEQRLVRRERAFDGLAVDVETDVRLVALPGRIFGTPRHNRSTVTPLF